MSSTGISAQGTAFQIATGTGGAKTITAIVVGNPTIFTATAHGFNNGDVVAIAGVTGTDAGLVNSLSFNVLYKTANTFALAVDSTGKTLTAAGTATPTTYTAVGNVHDYTGFDGAATDIDITTLASTAKEFIPGLVDNGMFTVNLYSD